MSPSQQQQQQSQQEEQQQSQSSAMVHVSFSDEIAIIRIPYTPEELICELFYSEDELDDMKYDWLLEDALKDDSDDNEPITRDATVRSSISTIGKDMFQISPIGKTRRINTTRSRRSSDNRRRSTPQRSLPAPQRSDRSLSISPRPSRQPRNRARVPSMMSKTSSTTSIGTVSTATTSPKNPSNITASPSSSPTRNGSHRRAGPPSRTDRRANLPRIGSGRYYGTRAQNNKASTSPTRITIVA